MGDMGRAGGRARGSKNREDEGRARGLGGLRELGEGLGQSLSHAMSQAVRDSGVMVQGNGGLSLISFNYPQSALPDSGLRCKPPKISCLKCRGDAHPGFHDNSLFSQNDAATLVAVEHTTGVSQADSERELSHSICLIPGTPVPPSISPLTKMSKGQSSQETFRRQARSRYQDNEGP